MEQTAIEKLIEMFSDSGESIVGEARIEYDEIKRRLNKLEALESFGVDNWEGYDLAMRELD